MHIKECRLPPGTELAPFFQWQQLRAQISSLPTTKLREMSSLKVNLECRLDNQLISCCARRKGGGARRNISLFFWELNLA